MSLDAIGIVSRDTKKSIIFYEILGVSLKQEGGPDHFEGTTPSGVRIMLDSIDLVKKESSRVHMYGRNCCRPEQ